MHFAGNRVPGGAPAVRYRDDVTLVFANHNQRLDRPGEKMGLKRSEGYFLSCRESPLASRRAKGLPPERFRHSDLHVGHIAPIPDWLENRIGETENHDVLDRLLAEIVVDAINLPLLQRFVYLSIELLRGLQICAKRFLDDYSSLIFVIGFLGSQPRCRDLLNERPIGFGGSRQIKHADR